MEPATYPASYSPPLARLTPDDHRAPLWVCTLICLVFVVLGVLTRLYVRFKSLGWDDWIILGAFMVGTAQFMTTIAGMVRGLGQSSRVLSDEKVAANGRIFLASEALFVITIWTVKHSVLATVERVLGPNEKMQRVVCWVLQAVTAMLGVASLVAILVSCDASTLLTVARNDQCTGQSIRWVAITVIDAITEISIFVLFAFFMSGLQMRGSMKTTVVMLLAFRLVCIAFAGIHASYVNQYVNSNDPGIGVVAPLVWQQLNMAYSLIAALLIALKGFLQSFDINFGNDQTYAHNSASRGGNSGGDRFNLKKLSGKKGSRFGRSVTSQKENAGGSASQSDDYGQEPAQYSTKVYHPSNEREGSVASGISQHPIIRYQVEYDVRHEDVPGAHVGRAS